MQLGGFRPTQLQRADDDDCCVSATFCHCRTNARMQKKPRPVHALARLYSLDTKFSSAREAYSHEV